MSKDLSGRWTGMFDYFGQVSPVGFTAQLTESEGAIAGLIEETEDVLDGLGPLFLTAFFEGERRGSHVSFRKTYDDLEPLCVVDYDGVVDADATEISGEWVRLEDGETGSFVMTRHAGREEDVARTRAAEVEISGR